MAKDIEEFLRMAASRRRETQGSPPPAAQRPPTQKNQQRPRKQAPRPSPIVGAAEVEVVPGPRESVAQHVAAHIDTSRLVESTKRLGAEVGKADDLLESRLHQTFDHQVGTITRRPNEAVSASPQDPSPNRAHPMLSALASPQGMRQAIIASEILKRPEWE
jgi:hypothetical protein